MKRYLPLTFLTALIISIQLLTRNIYDIAIFTYDFFEFCFRIRCSTCYTH